MTPLVAAAGPESVDAMPALVFACGPWLAAGAVVGAFHFLSLRAVAGMLATPSALAAALTLHLLRWVVTAGALTVIARHGAAALLAAAFGLLAARTAVVAVFGTVSAPPRAAAPHRDAAPVCGEATADTGQVPLA